MSPHQTQKTRLLQNLQDAGFPPDGIEEFMQCIEKKDSPGQMRILSEQRRKLLENIHKNQKDLDYLDYLIYQLKK